MSWFPRSGVRVATDVIAATVVLHLPRDATSVPLTRRVLEGALASLGVAEDCRDDMQLALSEACTNVIRHAASSEDYEVRVGVDERRCVIEVIDDGPGLDISSTETTMASPFDEYGRGLRIIALVSDEVEVRRRRPHGTLLRFVKRLTWPQ